MSPKKTATKNTPQHAHEGTGSNNSHPKPIIKEFIPSPNHSSRNGSSIGMIVMHCTEASLISTIATFRDGSADGRQVSAHYVIDKNGDIYQMVSDSDRANHCRGANRDSIGIEHVAGEKDPLTQKQSDASAALIRWLTEQYDIPLRRIYGQDFAPGYSGGGTSCPDALFGAHTQEAVQAWVAANVAVRTLAAGRASRFRLALSIGGRPLALNTEDREEILKVVCQELEVMITFEPSLTDDQGDPVEGASDAGIADELKEIDDQDTENPPPVPRLTNFVNNLNARLGELDLEPQQLAAGRFKTVGKLVAYIAST